MKFGIRRKLLLVYTTVALVGGISLFLGAGYQLENAVLAFYQRDLLTQTLLVAGTLPETMEHQIEGETNTAALQTALERSHSAGARIEFTLLSVSRTVIASTASPRSPLFSEVAATTEIAKALNGQTTYEVRAGASGERTVFTAAPIYYENRLIGILHASAPLAPAYAEAAQNWLNLARTALPILILTVAASLWLGRSIAKPIQQLNQSALRIARGEFDERVPVRTNDEISQLAQSFNTMAEQINKLLVAQRSFVSNAAHELRSPLANAQLRLEALQSETLSDGQRANYLAETSVEINQMSSLITQLLALARLDEGRLAQSTPLLEDPTMFLQDLARRWRIQAQNAGLTFESTISPSIPPLPISPEDLQIALDNLISNALKYTPTQGTIWLSAVSTPGTVTLSVRDNGEGFTAEDGQRLFDRFFRVDRARNKQVAGTGLGLSIARAIVEHHGGTISVHSDGPGRGAIFQITLPEQSDA